MNKRNILSLLGISALIIVSSFCVHFAKKDNTKDINNLTAIVLANENDKITIQDSNNVIYTFHAKDINADIGSKIVIEYAGVLDKSTEFQQNDIVSYTASTKDTNQDGIPLDWLDNGIFSQFYILANNKLKTMSLDEKIGQLLLVRHPDVRAKEDLKKYQFSGYVFFERDFKDKTTPEVQSMMKELQEVSKIPILTAVDEEGGDIVRVSSNPNLVSSKFKSSQDLYASGGFDAIRQDTIQKSKVLNNLGLNLNLAPVVDVSTDTSDYIYKRSFGQDTALTSTYAKNVIEASKGTKVSYTLKHFPGYGNNSDTHAGAATDNRTLEDIKMYDLPPFEAGIKVGAEAVMISHNTVVNIDPDNPASLSRSVHNLLRNDLKFTGIVMCDNLDMGAVTSISDSTVKAILAGNDLVIITDYESSISEIKRALNNGTVSEDLIDKLAFRVLAWKYYKGLMFEVQK